MDRVVFFYFCCDNVSPDGRDVQDGLTGRMVYQRHVADSLYFLHVVFGSVCKNFASFQHILWPSSYACWAHFDWYNPTALFFFCPYIKDQVLYPNLVMWLNFVCKPTVQLLLWDPRLWKTPGVKSSTVWAFCELQMALKLRSIELDEFLFQVKHSNSPYLRYSMFCV
jgi:hypothetical protein